MSRRKAWEELSPAYRERLKRAGITRRAHESRASIYKATGHKGREKPVPNLRANARKYLKEPTDRQKMSLSRDDLVERVQRHAYQLLGNKTYFNRDRVFQRIDSMPEVTLRLMLRTNLEQWEKLARQQYAKNPLFYH